MVRNYRKPELSDNRILVPVIKKLSDNITLFSPPKMLPKPMTPFSRRISSVYACMLIGRTVRKLKMDNAILWVYRPEYAPGIEWIPHSRLIFDLADDIASYGPRYTRRARFVAKCTEQLTLKSDLMIVTSPTLKKMYQDRAKKCILVTNGFDEKLFNGEQHRIPKDLIDIPRPIAGFVGTLFSFLDFQLLFNTARELSNVSFVFVGPVEQSGKDGVDLISKLDNTYFLGSKKKELIPSYVSNFDVCLNPFKVDNVSNAVSPLKVYEYLAMGKPVLSTPMIGLEKEPAGKWVHFASGSNFGHSLSNLIKTNAHKKVMLNQIQAAKQFSWSALFETLLFHVKEISS